MSLAWEDLVIPAFPVEVEGEGKPVPDQLWVAEVFSSAATINDTLFAGTLWVKVMVDRPFHRLLEYTGTGLRAPTRRNNLTVHEPIVKGNVTTTSAVVPVGTATRYRAIINTPSPEPAFCLVIKVADTPPTVTVSDDPPAPWSEVTATIIVRSAAAVPKFSEENVYVVKSKFVAELSTNVRLIFLGFIKGSVKNMVCIPYANPLRRVQ